MNTRWQINSYSFRAAQSSDQFKIAVMDLESRRVIRIFDLPTEITHLIRISWGDNNNFYFTSTCGERNPVWKQSLDADSPSMVGDLGPDELEDFTISPDGKEFAFIRGKWVHDAVLVEGLK